VTQKGTDRRILLYRVACWCWSRICILYGICHASFCLLRFFCTNV